MNNNKNTFRGTIALLTVASFYGMYGIFSRMIGENFGVFNQNWIRNIIVALLCLTTLWITKTKLISLQQRDLKWIIFWVLSGSWVTVLTFIAFNHLNIGTTYLVVYCSMITSGYVSGAIFFKERLNLNKVASIILTFVGLLTIFRFSVTEKDLVYVLIALVSGALTGLWNTLSKKFSDNYPNTQIVLMDSIASIVAALLGSILISETFPIAVPLNNWVWLVLYAFVQMVNVGLVVYGFKNLEAQIGSIILPVEIIFAMIFGYLFFRETQSVYSIIGASLIIIAAVLPSISLTDRKNNL